MIVLRGSEERRLFDASFSIDSLPRFEWHEDTELINARNREEYITHAATTLAMEFLQRVFSTVALTHEEEC
ncbi:hypothetical protein QTN25_000706 [Entamoeba marina]